jgi:hypothetical protein
MAPAQCLPFDVLGLIFGELVFDASQYDPFTALTELMLICGSWRCAVIGHPTLWSNIEFVPQDFITWKTQHRGLVPPIARVKIQLTRSRNALLNIAIKFPDSQEIHDTCTHGTYSIIGAGIRHGIEDCPGVKDRHIGLQLLLKTLAGHEGKTIERWRSFGFFHPEPGLLDQYCDLGVLNHLAPRLRDLMLFNWAGPGLFKGVPQLTALYLPSYNGGISVAPSMPAVREIYIEMRPDRTIQADMVLQFLSLCSNVQRVEIFGPMSAVSQLQAETRPLIRLSSLRHLDVHGGIFFAHVLATLDLPNLTSLYLTDDGDSGHGDILPRGPWNSWARNIQYLLFDSERPRVQVLRKLLDEAQSLEVLSADHRSGEYVKNMLGADHGLCPSLLELHVISSDGKTSTLTPFPARLAVQDQSKSQSYHLI